MVGAQLPCGALFLSAFCLHAGGVKASNYLFTVSDRSINFLLNLLFFSKNSLLNCLNCLTGVSFYVEMSIFFLQNLTTCKSLHILLWAGNMRERHVGSKYLHRTELTGQVVTTLKLPGQTARQLGVAEGALEMEADQHLKSGFVTYFLCDLGQVASYCWAQSSCL